MSVCLSMWNIPFECVKVDGKRFESDRFVFRFLWNRKMHEERCERKNKSKMLELNQIASVNKCWRSSSSFITTLIWKKDHCCVCASVIKCHSIKCLFANFLASVVFSLRCSMRDKPLKLSNQSIFHSLNKEYFYFFGRFKVQNHFHSRSLQFPPRFEWQCQIHSHIWYSKHNISQSNLVAERSQNLSLMRNLFM